MNKIILVYHSIGQNNLFLQVSEEQFKNQIKYLRLRASFCTLEKSLCL